MLNAENKHITITVPVYNEEQTLERSMRFLESAAIKTISETNFGIDVILCINDCTDNSEGVAKDIASDCIVPVHVIKSEKRGMVLAQTAALEYAKEYLQPGIITFLDADALIREDVLWKFIKQYAKHHDLMMVGAHPFPIVPRNLSVHDRIIHQMLNFRAYHPKSQLAVHDVSAYHPYAYSDPQPIGAEFELRSKIMIHGRCFSIRDYSVWDVPLDAVGEDLWLNLSVNKRYGPGSSRLLYDANVDFYPIDDIEHYIRVYARIYKDLENTVRKNPQFAKVAQDKKTYVNDEFLVLSPDERLAFELYKTLESVTNEQFEKGVYTSESIAKLWSYEIKEVKE